MESEQVGRCKDKTWGEMHKGKAEEQRKSMKKKIHVCVMLRGKRYVCRDRLDKQPANLPYCLIPLLTNGGFFSVSRYPGISSKHVLPSC